MKKIVFYFSLLMISLTLITACGKKDTTTSTQASRSADTGTVYTTQHQTFSFNAPTGLTSASEPSDQFLALVSPDGGTFVSGTRFFKADYTFDLKGMAWNATSQSIFSKDVAESDLAEMTIASHKGIGVQKEISDAKQAYDLRIFFYEDGDYYKGVTVKMVKGDKDQASTTLSQMVNSWVDGTYTPSYPLDQQITLTGSSLTTSIPKDWEVQADQSADHQGLYLSKDKSIALQTITATGTGSEEELEANAEQLQSQLASSNPEVTTPTIAGQKTYQMTFTISNQSNNTAITMFITQRGNELVVLRFESSPSVAKNLTKTMEDILTNLK